MQTIDAKLKSRIYGSGRGTVFSPNDFLDLGGRDAVDKALSRLTAKRTIRRLARELCKIGTRPGPSPFANSQSRRALISERRNFSNLPIKPVYAVH